ncbi:glycoside hydrolase family 3 C-terminal domain-containing protein [Nocardioides mangrovi]|uniref:Glycoside hydrolase family 3 C-terminal domain-containing protein n=1 Tax=Nocardioides mangrovi TaxID=2874580 RepID=A0ABS7UJL9_9ACTN|nr:glycoside hydrolase family 3 N-terminal domain-containing protein [Nocardioides mangrovi]MBZ5740042.1 glycoside hydrolase family 3 C-terminal domain-containing protein [Nocardioides mangrovi]MBZ5740787.1 glycoside hydrolase family 3 C-terminal domain-containing protein [Nocardioides mangrovi]
MTRLRPPAVLAAVALAAAALTGSVGGTATAATSPDGACAAWMDPHDSPSARARALVSAMSEDQELHMVTFGDRPPYLLYYGTAGHVTGIPDLCVPDLVLSDAGSGVAGLQVSTTTFPSGVAQASTWDPRLQRRVGRAIGEEAHQKGINVMLGPGMNIARTPYNGRNFEYFGEDPYLTSQMTVPFIEGIQDNPVIADAKHYALNDQETDRMTVDVRADERTMREIYLPPFEAAVKKADVGSVMCSYNQVGGAYACENPGLLTGILRDDWGFDGFVVSDWGAVHSTAPSAMAGLDLEMHAVPFSAPSTPVYGGGGRYFGASDMQAALDDGSLTRARLDEMVRNIVRPMFRLGLFDDPVDPSATSYLSDASTDAHLATARRVASEATVLLKNRDDLLPLGDPPGSVPTGRTIAVIGYAANPVGAASTTGGGGSSHGSGLPPSVVSPLQGMLDEAAARGDTVVYTEGSSVADARAAAAAADVAIVVASDGSSEGSDRTDLDMEPNACATLLCTRLPLQQEQMVSAVTAANPDSVVVLDVGGPVRMPWLDDAGAVLVTWYAGLQHGASLARIVYGEDEPSGRLPQTFPVDEEQVAMKPAQYPGVDGTVTYSEGLEVGYRWYDAHGQKPLFPFGFGLGYTTFDLRDLAVRRTGAGAVVRLTVQNTGDRAGSAVPQVYVGAPAAAGEPPWQLKGFDKVRLRPGESTRVTLRLDRRAFSRWSTARHGWVVTPGTYRIAVGRSSRDLPLRDTVTMR